MRLEEYIQRLEENLLLGSGRWIANFRESFRDLEIEGTRFRAVVRGNTRSGGFFLSRLVAYFALPNYQVACFVYCGQVTKKVLRHLLKVVQDYMKRENLAWSWLVLPREGAFSEGLRRAVERIESKEIGIALVDLTSGEVSTNSSYVGRRLRHIVKVR